MSGPISAAVPLAHLLTPALLFSYSESSASTSICNPRSTKGMILSKTPSNSFGAAYSCVHIHQYHMLTQLVCVIAALHHTSICHLLSRPSYFTFPSASHLHATAPLSLRTHSLLSLLAGSFTLSSASGLSMILHLCPTIR